MGVDVSRFKVIYGEKIFRAIAIMNMYMPKVQTYTIAQPNFLHILAINEEGNIVSINDEAWKFQFLPVING